MAVSDTDETKSRPLKRPRQEVDRHRLKKKTRIRPAQLNLETKHPIAEATLESAIDDVCSLILLISDSAGP